MLNCTVSSATLALMEICSGCRDSVPHGFLTKWKKQALNRFVITGIEVARREEYCLFGFCNSQQTFMDMTQNGEYR